MLLSVFTYFNGKENFKMFFRFIMLGMSFVVILFIFDVLLPKLKLKYRLHKELKEKEKRQAMFRNKMKELEIK